MKTVSQVPWPSKWTWVGHQVKAPYQLKCFRLLTCRLIGLGVLVWWGIMSLVWSPPVPWLNPQNLSVVGTCTLPLPEVKPTAIHKSPRLSDWGDPLRAWLTCPCFPCLSCCIGCICLSIGVIAPMSICSGLELGRILSSVRFWLVCETRLHSTQFNGMQLHSSAFWFGLGSLLFAL